ncbi:HotDog domain-containing protein [Talaromyces proteolyticus]|uniref:HotDog domain-containing protein n=1 Tax=Talaromyces proteolyticus TaxID=1131652 RepID=A0AAD4PST0_9EURO|nr:HotDog domain-containing protein [Talaromyces proteolyticus]KAH8689578.1 HotDog domain-containing protein [Talaromyces proteolyticus]
MASCLVNVKEVWDRQRKNSPIYALLLEDIEVYHAETGLIKARLLVKSLHVNSKGTLHGTLSACVVDWASGMAIASHGATSTGVSTDMSVSFLSTAKEGDIVEIEGRTGKVGKTLAFTTVTISKETEGKRTIVVQGSHTKYVRQ